jgi:hypothetical protein
MLHLKPKEHPFVGTPILPRAKNSKQHHHKRRSQQQSFGTIKVHSLWASFTMGNTVTAEHYCSTLERLQQAVCHKRCGLVHQVTNILHNNITPHTANHTCDSLRYHSSEVRDNRLYSTNLMPHDFHFSGPLKKHLASK